MSDEIILSLENVGRVYRQAGEELHVLRGANLTLKRGEIVALVGPSGAGKSTLLHLAGLLERPDSGTIKVLGRDAGDIDDNTRTALRRQAIGFVYQFHHLLPEFSAAENIVIPQMIAGKPRAAARKRAFDLLDMVGLAPRASHRPARLSGGEQQRVAITRALANGPALLLGDEPTGNLDQHTADGVMAMMVEIVRKAGLAALIATHNLDLARRMDRILSLEDGVLTERAR